MSLRLRLIVFVTLALGLSLVLGGAVAGLSASRSVRTEMDTALSVARQTIGIAVAEIENASDWRRDLGRLVASFSGNRHLRVALSDQGIVAAPPREAANLGDVPSWFVRLIGVAPVTETVPVVIAGATRAAIIIETVPHNEVVEVWNAFEATFLIMIAFSGATVGLIFLLVGRALRPLGRLSEALAAVGRGDYHTRIEGPLPPDLSRLRDSFNLMAAKLARMAEQNRGLTNELLTLQEQERGDIARDLHDEVGPFLFAINIDIANVARALEHGSAIEPHLHSIADAVGHMQQQVRDMLGRLRPIGLAEFGLATAIRNLVGFWRRRHPEIDFTVDIPPGIEGFGDTIDLVIYRVVQEGLSNAMRHGMPGRVGIAIAKRGGRDAETLVVTVSDDGPGIADAAGLGYGILGMTERVRGSGGRLTIDNRPGAGLTVTATLPLRAAPRVEAAQS